MVAANKSSIFPFHFHTPLHKFPLLLPPHLLNPSSLSTLYNKNKTFFSGLYCIMRKDGTNRTHCPFGHKKNKYYLFYVAEGRESDRKRNRKRGVQSVIMDSVIKEKQINYEKAYIYLKTITHWLHYHI